MESNVLQRMANAIENHSLATPQTPVLLMVSGGSDSTAMAYLASDLREQGVLGPMAMLHVNHRLRGADSDADAAFVRGLSLLLDIPLFSCDIDMAQLVGEEGGNLEAIARRERFATAADALRSLCAHFGISERDGKIFTAHTADDRVENFYMRSIVGTGPGGFRSMDWLSGNVAHPLLGCGRQELRNFLQARSEGDLPVLVHEGMLWREDATNAETDRFRAFVRHTIVPQAKERNPRLLETLGRTMDLVADEDDFLEDLTAKACEACVQWESALPGARSAWKPAAPKPPVQPEYDAGCVLAPQLGLEPLPIRRRAVFRVLQLMLGVEARVENASVQSVLDAWGSSLNDGASTDANASTAAGPRPVGGYVTNIQGNLAVSANKYGVRIEPMAAFRARRKR